MPLISLIWAIWKESNIVVFEDEIFSPNRLKTSFNSALITWAWIIANVERSIVRILLCILQGLWLDSLRKVGIYFCPFLLYRFGALVYY